MSTVLTTEQKQIIEAQTIQRKILDLHVRSNKLLEQCYKCFGDTIVSAIAPDDACKMLNRCKALVQMLHTTFNVLVLEFRKNYVKSLGKDVLSDSSFHAIQAEVELRETYNDFRSIYEFSNVFKNSLYEHIYLHILAVKQYAKSLMKSHGDASEDFCTLINLINDLNIFLQGEECLFLIDNYREEEIDISDYTIYDIIEFLGIA